MVSKVVLNSRVYPIKKQPVDLEEWGIPLSQKNMFCQDRMAETNTPVKPVSKHFLDISTRMVRFFFPFDPRSGLVASWEQFRIGTIGLEMNGNILMCFLPKGQFIIHIFYKCNSYHRLLKVWRYDVPSPTKAKKSVELIELKVIFFNFTEKSQC